MANGDNGTIANGYIMTHPILFSIVVTMAIDETVDAIVAI